MKNKIGLVLEGGAMRGMYTSGILDFLLEKNIAVDIAVGVSAGALFGVNYVSLQKGRAIRYNKKYNQDKDYLGLRPLLKEGNIVSQKYAYVKVPYELDPFDNETFKASKTKFYAVITSMNSGKAEYVHIADAYKQMDVLRASGSMPLVSTPVCLDNELYLDGAVADSIPFEWMLANDADKIIVILTRDITYKKKPIPSVFTNIYKKKYPLFAKAMANRHDLYNGQIDRLKKLENEGKIFVIRPSKPINISHIERNPKILQEVYDLGRSDVIAIYDSLIQYLTENQ